MSNYAFHFDGTRCTGCKTCVMSCKDHNGLGTDTAYRRVFEMEGGACVSDGAAFHSDTYVYYVSLACNHCDHPACTKACPTHAMHKDEETGLVGVDASRCIGCGYCAMACPYGAPKVDREKGHSVKCDGCVDRVRAGKQPICVEACPARALLFGDVADMAALGERASFAPLPDPKYTQPNLFAIASEDAKPTDEKSVRIGNTLEVK